MTTIECSVDINAPISAVFAYASDWRKWPEWFEGVSDFRSRSSVHRGNGARYSYRAKVMGIRAMVETEIQDFEENRGWTGVSTRGLPHRTRWSFEPHGSATKFTYTLEYQMPVPVLGRLLDVLIVRRQWHGILDRSLGNLQRVLACPEPARTGAATDQGA